MNAPGTIGIHLLPNRLAGVVCWIAVALATSTQAGDSEAIAAVTRAGTAGPPMLLGTSVMSSLENQLVHSLGFSHSQSDSDHLTVNEIEPGRWDWTNADNGLAAMQQAGMKWQYFPHFHWAPEWYRNSSKFVPLAGLRTHRKLAVISLWSPDIVPWFDHGYAALARHYGSGNDKLFAIYLGIYGDFGETIFPMGWHPDEKKRFGEEGTGRPDFWCGDDYARNDFRLRARSRYRTVAGINAAWGTQFKNFAQVDYPPAAYQAGAEVTRTAQQRRYWLDFIQWYYDSMTKFTGEVCRMARHHFPRSLLEIPVGGGGENLMFAQDTAALPKVARQYGVHVRSTHGGFAPFPQACATMIKKIATACKVYDVPHWLEPPGAITPAGEVSRMMEAISCGNYGFWDWGANPVAAAQVFRQYTNYFTREKPVVDVALFFPTTDHRLHPDIDFPTRLRIVGTQLRDVMDFDMVDEELIADDALKDYRALVWVEGKFIEEKTLKTLAGWIKQGGVLVCWGLDPPQTVEGSTRLGAQLLGLVEARSLQEGGPLEIKNPAFLCHLAAHAGSRAASTVSVVDKNARTLATAAGRPAIWATPRGKGWVIVGGGEQTSFSELVRDVTYNLSKLDSAKKDAPELDADWDGVYATLLANGEVMLLNDTSEPRRKTIAGTTMLLPPKSLRSVLFDSRKPVAHQ